MIYMAVVLISTYWNVNQAFLGNNIFLFLVLISTYWNVNVQKYEAFLMVMQCFNLNLLECK